MLPMSKKLSRDSRPLVIRKALAVKIYSGNRKSRVRKYKRGTNNSKEQEQSLVTCSSGRMLSLRKAT